MKTLTDTAMHSTVNSWQRLQRQLKFIIEIDKLKQVVRQTLLMDGSRQENSAEHSWHLAMMTILLCEHARDRDIDVTRVLKMVLIHDLVEIDAGDTFCYDDAGRADQFEREQLAAERIFNLLPVDQTREFHDLWNEFEAHATPEAEFARALDRLQPIIHNYNTCGEAWRRHGIRRAQVVDRNRHMRRGAPLLWAYAQDLIEQAVDKGYLAP